MRDKGRRAEMDMTIVQEQKEVFVNPNIELLTKVYGNDLTF